MARALPPQTGWTPAMSTLADRWDGFLQKYVNAAGGVDYIAIAGGEGEKALDEIVQAHAEINPAKLTDGAKKALYINLYNATMVAHILRWARDNRVDIKSDAFLQQEVNNIKTSGGNIWNGSYRVNLGGRDVHLDNIEHGLIRGQLKGDDALQPWKVSVLDPRIHAAVNCAAMSCPRVREKAYRPETIEDMLDENMREWLSASDQFGKKSESTLSANRIVFWYYSDFDEHGRKVLKLKGAGDYLARFVKITAPDAAWKSEHLKNNFNNRGAISLKLSSAFSFFYDWRIADTRRKK